MVDRATIAAMLSEITRLRSLRPPVAPITLAVPEDLLWRISTHLRVLAGLLLSGEVRAEVAADQAAVFALLTEAPHAPV